MQQDQAQDWTQSWIPEMLPQPPAERAPGWQSEAELLELMQAEVEADLHASKYARTHWREGRERNVLRPVRSSRQSH